MAKSTAGRGSAAAEKREKIGKPGKAASPESRNIFARIGTYLHDVRSEMTRVVWPTRSEVLNSSVVVIVTLIFFIGFILVVDYSVVIPVIKFISNLRIGG